MAAPVVNSPLTLDCVVNVSTQYKIHATNHPTSFNATGLPASLAIVTASGRIQGRVLVAGVYSVTISATNADGTGTATLVITATDTVIGGGGNTGVSTFQSKFWTTVDETFDIADLDATGQPVCSFDPGIIGTTELSSTAIANKVAAIGGPGFIGQYTFPKDTVVPGTLRGRGKVATITMPGVSLSDIVVMGDMLSTALVYTAYVTIGVAITNGIDIYVYHEAGTATIFAGTFVNFRVYLFT